MIFQFPKKTIRWYLFSMEYHVYWLLESSCFEILGDGKYELFSSQKVDENMIFTDYWKVLVLNFSEMENTVFFYIKSWLKNYIYWLLKSSCLELVGGGKYGFFHNQEVDGKMICIDYWKVLVLNFSVMRNMIFFQPKIWWKDNIYLVFLSFPWYFRTWKICLFCAVTKPIFRLLNWSKFSRSK